VRSNHDHRDPAGSPLGLMDSQIEAAAWARGNDLGEGRRHVGRRRGRTRTGMNRCDAPTGSAGSKSCHGTAGCRGLLGTGATPPCWGTSSGRGRRAVTTARSPGRSSRPDRWCAPGRCLADARQHRRAGRAVRSHRARSGLRAAHDGSTPRQSRAGPGDRLVSRGTTRRRWRGPHGRATPDGCDLHMLDAAAHHLFWHFRE
jgi:hypothetical protein